jgi:2-oxoglutarate dehydrogenase E1 component
VKWAQRSNLVLLLPHGYEGQGPDHSSARIERYLSMSAEGNWVIAMPSTPANYFHLLRLHTLGARKRPLIVFTPKSMLRLRAASSMPEDFTTGRFQTVISEPTDNAAQIRRVLLCSGKVYYDLIKKREALGRSDVAILRVERLYPLPTIEISAALAAYPDDIELVWVQEEPANQGAWPFVTLRMQEQQGIRPLSRVSRNASAAPSTGSHNMHDVEQEALLDAAFA